MPLRVTPFRGDTDIDELHSFFLPERHYVGDALWSFGTSLKSAYVNSFEFMNHAPVVQLWRDEAAVLQAVSRISLGTGEWFHLATPDHRTEDLDAALRDHADATFALLTDHDSWATVRYESKKAEIRQLELAGYERADAAEVFMTMTLEHPIDEPRCGAGVRIDVLDVSDAHMVHERAMAQIDAFSNGEPTESEAAWISRSLPHQLSYGRPRQQPSIVAVAADETIVAFADPFYDHRNCIGEFEPVGTRTSWQQKGLSKLVMTRALNQMRVDGMSQAIVRTGVTNHAAIAAYESVGFNVTDHLIQFRKARVPAAVSTR